MTSGDSSLVGTIRYRLGAFGFLSSDEVSRFGIPNAVLLDQNFALEWSKEYISSFGGNPDKVTISGELAGAGSVMLQTMVYGGDFGTSLLSSAIVQVPVFPRYGDTNIYS